MTSGRSPTLRLRQGFALLAGAVIFSLIVGSGPDTFYWTPLGIGLVHLAAASSGGREGGYWSGALVLVGWGPRSRTPVRGIRISTSRACTSPAPGSARAPRSPPGASASRPTLWERR